MHGRRKRYCSRANLHFEASTDVTFVTKGNISQLNKLARETKADYIIHTGDFGFYGLYHGFCLYGTRTGL